MEQPNRDTDKVTVHEDYIEVVWNGPQTAEKVQRTNLDTLAAANSFIGRGQPVLILFSVHNHPAKPDMGAFKEVLKIFDTTQINRIATTGEIPQMIMSLVSTVSNTFTKSFEMKNFKDEDEALAWLRELRP
jgi:hypothetical protein